jgi:hypothetical protein
MNDVSEVGFEKSVVEAQLAVGLSRIQFYKTDGSLREMVVTRDMSIIPEDKRPSNDGKTRMLSDTTIPVYDVESNSWKSFVLENLIVIDRE